VATSPAEHLSLKRDLLTLDYVIQLTGWKKTKTYEDARTGKLPFPTLRNGRRYYFSRRAYEAWRDGEVAKHPPDDAADRLEELGNHFELHDRVPRVVAATDLETYRYDVAFSFAGTERNLAAELAKITQANGYRVFYDRYDPHSLWGEDLPNQFNEIYRRLARFCVIFVSRNYLNGDWTRQELRSALARSVEEPGKAYILPVRVDHVELPGLPSTIGYLSLKRFSIDQIAEQLVMKLNEDRRLRNLPNWSSHGTFQELD